MKGDPELARHRPPSLAVDVVLATLHAERLHVLMLRRAAAPFADHWVLPGGFVRLDETLEQAVARVLQQKAGIADTFVEQLYTFGELDRDARGRVVAVAYYALVPWVRRAGLPAETCVADIHAPWHGPGRRSVQ